MAGSRRREPWELTRLLQRILALWWAYVKGQMLLAVITGSLIWLFGVAVGLSWPFFLGLLAGVLDFIPTFGPIIAAVPAVIVALWRGSSTLSVENWLFALIVLAGYFLVQQVVSLLVSPQIHGRRLDLHPLLVFVAVIAGAAVAHVAGAYLAIPLLLAAREIVTYARRKARGLAPFPEEAPGAPDAMRPPPEA